MFTFTGPQIDTALNNTAERIGNIEELHVPKCPSEPNYKIVGPDQTCYFFEVVKKNFANAQANCDKKFGFRGGHLAEPQTADRSALLNKYAQEILNNQRYYWIGYDDLGHGTGNFRYSTTHSVSSITGLNYDGFDGASGEHCAAFNWSSGNGHVDDKKCENEYSSICEFKKIIK